MENSSLPAPQGKDVDKMQRSHHLHPSTPAMPTQPQNSEGGDASHGSGQHSLDWAVPFSLPCIEYLISLLIFDCLQAIRERKKGQSTFGCSIQTHVLFLTISLIFFTLVEMFFSVLHNTEQTIDILTQTVLQQSAKVGTARTLSEFSIPSRT